MDFLEEIKFLEMRYVGIWLTQLCVVVQARAACISYVAGFLTFMSIGAFPSFVEDMKVFTILMLRSVWIRVCQNYSSQGWIFYLNQFVDRYLRYVGVIQFVIHVHQLLPVRFTQQNLYCISKFTLKHQQKSNWKLDLSWFSYGYQKCMFLDIFTE